MTNPRFTHLGLTEWPFKVVPDSEFCTFLADRQKLSGDIQSLLVHLLRHDASSIHIFWAWFGAGKTHTLYYLANESRKMTADARHNGLVTLYSEFPRSVRSFVDIYRTFAANLNMDMLCDAYLEMLTCLESDRLKKQVESASADLSTALHVLVTGKREDHLTAVRWLQADDLPISEFRAIGVAQKINNTDRAARILAALIHLLNAASTVRGRSAGRVVWIIDEFQRIEKTGRLVAEINTGLHSVFNSCPTGLSLLLSFSGTPDKKLPPWFSPELKDRIGMTKVMILPPMMRDEALVFVKDLLAHFRPVGYDHKAPLFPFSSAACEAIISAIEKVGDIEPRAIMQAFNAVLEEADSLLETGKMKTIDSEFVKGVIADRIILTVQEDGVD